MEVALAPPLLFVRALAFIYAPIAMPPITPTPLQDLLLDPATHPRGQPHLSAASGLVRAGAWLYLVADDEHHLGLLPAGAAVLQQAPLVQLYRILQGDLPAEPKARKKHKPDLEALALLPASPAHPSGALLALGSGSKPNRQQGVVIALDATGRPDGAAQVLDLSALYAPLRAEFADLNIEGAFVANEVLHLLQRGKEPVYDLSGAALRRNRDEWMLRMRRMGSCPCKQPGRPIARFRPNPSGKCLAGRSAALRRLLIAGLSTAHRALHPIPARHLRGLG